MSFVKILFLCTIVPFLNICQEKDDIQIVARGVQEVRIPIKQLPLVADDEHIMAGSFGVSFGALFGTTLYGWMAQPFPFDNSECEIKYWKLIYEQSLETNRPCVMKSGFRDCIEALVPGYCEPEKDEYNRQLPDKKIAAWTPLMVVATASVAFNGGWLLGKWLERKMNARNSLKLQSSTALEMEQV